MTRWPLPMRFLLVIAVLIAAAPPRAGAARPKATRGISGQVLQVGGVTPIASVQVLIRGEGIGVSTNTDGRFVLPEVPSGAVEVVFLHPCYFPVHVALQATGDAVVAIGLPKR